MHEIHISDPAWRSTFPPIVTPLPNAWIAGVLLRCDERNFWGSGTTLKHVLRPGSKQSAMNELSTIVPTVIDLERLAQVLFVAVSRIVATTYLAELARLYGNEQVHAKLLSSSLTFHVCPACIADNTGLLWSVRVHVEQICACFTENRGPLPVTSVALIGKPFPTWKETPHKWKQSNTFSPPTIFSGRGVHQSCLPAPSGLSTTV